MEPKKVAAQFAAYVWCLDGAEKTPAEAARFAQESWQAFLPVAHEGLGQLLIRVADLDEKENRKARKATVKRNAHRLLKGRKTLAVAG